MGAKIIKILYIPPIFNNCFIYISDMNGFSLQ